MKSEYKISYDDLKVNEVYPRIQNIRNIMKSMGQDIAKSIDFMTYQRN